MQDKTIVFRLNK